MLYITHVIYTASLNIPRINNLTTKNAALTGLPLSRN
jgi:hypothetical protein